MPNPQSNDPSNDHSSITNQLRRELLAVIRRFGQERDVTVYQAIGVLEIVKLDLADMLGFPQASELMKKARE